MNSGPGAVEFFPKAALTLMLVTSEHTLFLGEVRMESKASRAIGDDSVAVDRHRPTHELTEVVPIEVVAVFKLPHQAFGIEAVTRLP